MKRFRVLIEIDSTLNITEDRIRDMMATAREMILESETIGTIEEQEFSAVFIQVQDMGPTEDTRYQ